MIVAQKKQFELFEDNSSSDLALSTVGKMLHLSPRQFIKALSDQKMIFKGKASQAWEAYQSYVEKGFFRHHTVMICHSSGELIPHIQVKITPKGFQALKELLLA